MLENLVWLFPQYRQLVAVNHELQTEIEKLRTTLEILTRPGANLNPDPTTMLEHAKDTIFAEQPFPDGIIPENLWVSPGETR